MDQQLYVRNALWPNLEGKVLFAVWRN